jgi:hypothetical protein
MAEKKQPQQKKTAVKDLQPKANPKGGAKRWVPILPGRTGGGDTSGVGTGF